ncbi:hypothetical protein DCAR_0518562 [Daucus carota subsp. sativus]|uniref:Uncharacterized protein n=1 Tax=Daucus carota subsp. sativus TaxID=79200 RepID=A0AAF0X166_DAUCS|nr:hypothetical protein DCAR_0518562 [Daucus carota subsp. sativus]
MSRMVTCAAACVRHLARLRPKMSEILGYCLMLCISNFIKQIFNKNFEKFKNLLFENLESSSECSGLNDVTQQPSPSSSERLRV